MIIRIEQTNKELFSADFQILSNNNKIGEMHFRGSKVGMEGVWDISFLDHKVSQKKLFKFNTAKCHRPYTVNVDSLKNGTVYMTYKGGKYRNNITYHRLELDGLVYELFPIGFGSEMKSPVFLNGRQVALTEKDFTIYNDLHHFDISAVDEESTLATIIICCFMYAVAYYKPGVKVEKSVHKGYFMDKNEELLAMYDPEFKSKNFIV